MRQKITGDIISLTNSQKVLSFLIGDSGREFLAKEIQKATSLSKAGVYRALNELIRQKLVSKYKRGRLIQYSAIHHNPIVKQFKVLKNIIQLKRLVEHLKNSSRKIVLYGSASRGEDSLDSDIDLFIISKEPPDSQKVISQFKSKRKIQAVIKTSTQISELQTKDREFYREVDRGIILWEEGYEP